MVRSAVLITAVSVALSLVAAAGGTVDTRPALRMTDTTPLTLRGQGFPARKAVTVRVVHEQGRSSKRVLAGRAGGFIVRFDRLAVDPCTIRSIVAIGAGGGRASVKLPPAQCPQPPAP